MPSQRSRGEVNWKLIVSLVLLFFLAGTAVHQQRRISGLERDLSLVRLSIQNLENKTASRRSSFFDQFAPAQFQFKQGQTQSVTARSARVATPILSARKPQNYNGTETPQQMIAAAMSGDNAALDRLDDFASEATAEGKSADETDAALNQIRAGFALMSEEAANGNSDALGILWRATSKSYLAGLATDAIGHAAALGNEIALELLLNPDQNGILISSAVGALTEVAETGNDLAIQALVLVGQDESKSALWYLAASGLQHAAESGNESAIEALGRFLNSPDNNVRAAARQGLERASLNGYTLAADALAQTREQ